MFYTFSFVLFNCSTFIIHKMALISSTVGPFLRILKLILILFLGCFLLLCYWSFRSCEPHVLQHYCACLYQSNTEINVRIRTCDGKGTSSHPDVALFHFHHSNLPVVIFQTLILLLRQKKKKPQLVMVTYHRNQKMQTPSHDPGALTPLSENL